MTNINRVAIELHTHRQKPSDLERFLGYVWAIVTRFSFSGSRKEDGLVHLARPAMCDHDVARAGNDVAFLLLLALSPVNIGDVSPL